MPDEITNQVSKIDVSHKSKLTELKFIGNGITELDVSNNPELYWLICTNNNIKKLDLTNNDRLFSGEAYYVDSGVQIIR